MILTAVFLYTDDTYNGMLIPKDANIFIGVWQIHHDESIWKDPATFMPERYHGYDKLASYYAGSSDWAGRDKSNNEDDTK